MPLVFGELASGSFGGARGGPGGPLIGRRRGPTGGFGGGFREDEEDREKKSYGYGQSSYMSGMRFENDIKSPPPLFTAQPGKTLDLGDMSYNLEKGYFEPVAKKK
jgi:hypothetical protein